MHKYVDADEPVAQLDADADRLQTEDAIKEWYIGKRILSRAPAADVAPIMTKWIPCKERTPDNHYEVIVSIREIQDQYGTIVHEFTSAGSYDIVRKRWHVGHFYRTDVVAWMPLPQPYKDSDS